MIKNIILCSSVFLLIAFITPGFADEHFPFLAEVSKESVNVRAGPNTNFEKVDKLTKDSRVIVSGRSYEWFKVEPLPSTKAYIRCDYLKLNEGSNIAVVQGDRVNVRASFNSNASSLGQVTKGTLVKVMEQTEGWCRLEPMSGIAVWIHQDFLVKVSDEIPVSLLTPVIQPPVVVKEVKEDAARVVTQRVALQGRLKSIAASGDTHVTYQITIDDITYYLQDVPQMSLFADRVVTVEGVVVPDPDKKFAYPVVKINTISLLL